MERRRKKVSRSIAKTKTRFLVYGLRMPGSDDIRYVGKSRSGMKRVQAAARYMDECRERNDWVRSLHLAGTPPDWEILHECSSGLELDESYQAWLVKLGSQLFNDDHTRNTDVFIGDGREVLLSKSWSKEKAWWLGVTFGDGHNHKRGQSTFLKSEDRDLVARWSALGAGNQLARSAGDGSWESTVYSVDINDMVASYGMLGKKDGDLTWPDEIPEEYIYDFIRGLWDTDGNVEWYFRTDRKKDYTRCLFSNKSKNICDKLVSIFDGSRAETQTVHDGEYAGNEYFAAAASGEAAVNIYNKIYRDAPSHLRCERKYLISNGYVDWFFGNAHDCACGRRLIGSHVTQCKFCMKVVYVGEQVCAECHLPAKLVAMSRCQKCYDRIAYSRRKAWEGTSKTNVIDELFAQWTNGDGAKKADAEQRIFKIYRSADFPWRVLKEHDEADAIEAVRRSKITVSERDKTIANVGFGGLKSCTAAHLHRYEANFRGCLSVVEAYDSDDHLMAAIQYQLKNSKSAQPLRIIKALSALNRNPSNFPPVLAKWIVDRYAPENGVVLDPCAGYGGRLLGTLASERRCKYIGFDPEPKTVAANNKLAALAPERCDIGNGYVEDLRVWPKADLVMTCPPYYDRENYGRASQSIIERYSDVNEWVDGFLVSLIKQSMESSPTLVLCVSPFRLSNGVQFDLPSAVREVVDLSNGCIVDEWEWHTANFGTNKRFETLFVISRP